MFQFVQATHGKSLANAKLEGKDEIRLRFEQGFLYQLVTLLKFAYF